MRKWLSGSRLAIVAAVAMGLSAVLGPWLGDPASFVYPQIAIVVLVLVGFWRRVPDFSLGLDPRAWKLLLAASLVWLEAVALSQFYAFRVNGVDFSIFDWMLESTHRGRFGYSPIYDVNHFGVHSSFVLLLWVPLHELVDSPLWLVVSGPLAVWLGIFPLRRLARSANGGPHGALELMLVLMWVGNPWMGRAFQPGFRPELLVPFLTLWFLVGWVERDGEIVGLSLFPLLMTKEDAVLFVVGFVLVGTALERWRWKQALWLVALCGGWLAAYVFLVQPLLVGRPATYWGFWRDFGDTPKAVVVGMATHPVLLLTKVVGSGWWTFFLPLLLVPFRSLRAVGGMAPTLILLGAASYPVMHDFLGYYPLPLLAFAVFGVLETHARWRTLPSARLREGVVLTSIGLFGVVGGSYPRTVPVDLELNRTLGQAFEEVRSAPIVCVEPVLFPRAGYSRAMLPLMDEACLDRPGAVALVNLSLDTSPHDTPSFEETVRRWQATLPWRDVGRGFLVIGPRPPR